MVEIFEIFWASPIELRVIIIGIPIVFILLAYLGISGTNEAIDFQNRLWKEEQWRKRNNK
jgi:2-methylaconitate cis-trans-isomerase PrpF